MWAFIGALIVALDLYLVTRWASSSDLERVPTGPDAPPQWMKVTLSTGQILIPAIGVYFLYRYVVKPWRTERTVPFTGLVCLGALPLSIWDPTSTYVQPWFAYNSYLLNSGNPLSALPGWLSLNEPGAAVAWPWLLMPGVYVVALGLTSAAGNTLYRLLRRRLPAMSTPRLLGICVGVMVVAEFIFEAVLFLPMGFWSYGGGSAPVVFGGHYFQFPLNEFLHATVCFSGVMFLSVLTDDRGQTLVERGSESITGGPTKKVGIRLLAVIAGMQFIVLAAYHIPQMLWALNSPEWPDDVKNRSYFTNQCGEHLNRACPGPNVPVLRPGSGYLNWQGQYVPAK